MTQPYQITKLVLNRTMTNAYLEYRTQLTKQLKGKIYKRQIKTLAGNVSSKDLIY